MWTSCVRRPREDVSALIITRDERIGGVPLHAIRDALRAVNTDLFGVAHLAQRLALPEEDARRLVTELARRGFIEPNPMGPESWKTTTLGKALKSATLGRGFTRAAAERALTGLVRRAREVNGDPSFLFRVQQVSLFGSLLDPDVQRVGDADVVVELEPKDSDPERHQAATEEYARRQTELGGSVSTAVEFLFWAQTDTVRYLKARSPILEFHRPDDMALETRPPRVLFDAT